MYRTTWNQDEQASTAVVVAVAEATETDPTDLDVLNDYVDGDALDRVLSGSSAVVELSFEYDGATVHITSDGALVVNVDN